MNDLKKRSNTAWPKSAQSMRPINLENYRKHCANMREHDKTRAVPDTRQTIRVKQSDPYKIAIVKNRARTILESGGAIDAQLLRLINQL